MPPLTASIVVNTYNRARTLERLLPSLERLDDVCEVVVVNGPSTDDTEAVLARYATRLKVARCPVANLSRSRNIGIAAAAGDVVVFIDDDALPGDEQWLGRLLAAFGAGDEECRVGAAGGPSLHRDGEWPEFAGGWTSDYAEQRFSEWPAPEGDGWYRRTVGNNSAFLRAALVDIGGFDERIPYYLDEADVCLRLSRAGYAIVHVPDAPVRHYPAPSPIGPPFIRNRRIIARSDTYYSLKNGRHGWLGRLWTTLRLAPRKHFVTEVSSLVADGRLTAGQARAIRWQWLRGLVEGLVLGLGSGRRLALTAATPPAFVPFQRPAGSTPLSIALVARHLPPDSRAGGVGRYTADLARGLFELGHRVTLLTEGEAPVTRLGLGYEIVGLRPGAAAPAWSQTPVLAANLAFAAAVGDYVSTRHAGDRPFDVVHATNWGFEGYGVAAWGGCPLTLMLVTPLESVMAAEGWDRSVDLAANIHLDQWTVDAADRVCAPSGRVESTYARRAGWSGAPVHPVALGTVLVQSSVQSSAQSAAEARDAGRGPRLLFVGRLERRKGIHVLLEVLPAVLQQHPDWHCELVGNDTVQAEPGLTFKDQFLTRHAGAPWLSRVEFTGTIPDTELARRYARADVFVAPSLFESFGLIYVEAMQHGAAVVGTTVGGVPDVVTDGVDGLLVSPGDTDALHAALDRLMGDAALRQHLGGAARQSAAARTHVSMADRMVPHYVAAIETHARRGRPASTEPLDAQALACLDQCADTRGLSLASRAAEAYAGGAHEAAATLIAEALGHGARADHYSLAIELALGRSPSDAATLASRGFDATRDLSEACLAAAAVLLSAPQAHPRPASWTRWLDAHEARLAEHLLAAATGAVRASRDRTAVALLEVCHARSGHLPRVHAQAALHLGSALKRLGRTSEARATLDALLSSPEAGMLEAPLLAALRFHLGDLALAADDPATAIAHLTACLTLMPGHTRARQRLDDAHCAVAA